MCSTSTLSAGGGEAGSSTTSKFKWRWFTPTTPNQSSTDRPIPFTKKDLENEGKYVLCKNLPCSIAGVPFDELR